MLIERRASRIEWVARIHSYWAGLGWVKANDSLAGLLGPQVSREAKFTFLTPPSPPHLFLLYLHHHHYHHLPCNHPLLWFAQISPLAAHLVPLMNLNWHFLYHHHPVGWENENHFSRMATSKIMEDGWAYVVKSGRWNGLIDWIEWQKRDQWILNRYKRAWWREAKEVRGAKGAKRMALGFIFMPTKGRTFQKSEITGTILTSHEKWYIWLGLLKVKVKIQFV